mgnify:CR=1 FL=1
MKIYNKVIIDVETGKTIYEDSFEYGGVVAKCGGGGGDSGKPAYSVASQIIKGMKGPLSGAVKQDIVTNPFMDYGSQQYKQAVSDIRGGYGARGLEGSGIAIKGEQGALQKIASQVQAQRAGQLVGLLGTASGAPSFPAASQGGK